MLKSPSKREKTARRSFTKLMKSKLSFRTKDRIDTDEFGVINRKKSGKKYKLPKGIPTEIVFRTDSEDYDDEVSCESDFKDIPDLVSAETPITKMPLPSSESSSSEQQTTDWVQSLPDRFQSLQNTLFANRKGLLAVSAAALVCTQVPETTKLQLSVFAAGLSSTIMEQSKTLVRNKATIMEQSKTLARDKPPKRIKKKIKSVTNGKLPLEKSQDNITGESSSRAVPVERNSSPHATLQEYNFNSGALQESNDIVTSQVRGSMPEKNENGILVQSNIMVQQDGTNTIIVQNNIVIPDGSKSTIVLQSNNIEGASIQAGTKDYSSVLAAPREIVNGMTDTLEPEGNVARATLPADDELPPECYNVFKNFLNKDCDPTSGETESKERNWIESLLIDAWILNMDI